MLETACVPLGSRVTARSPYEFQLRSQKCVLLTITQVRVSRSGQRLSSGAGESERGNALTNRFASVFSKKGANSVQESISVLGIVRIEANQQLSTLVHYHETHGDYWRKLGAEEVGLGGRASLWPLLSS